MQDKITDHTCRVLQLRRASTLTVIVLGGKGLDDCTLVVQQVRIVLISTCVAQRLTPSPPSSDARIYPFIIHTVLRAFACPCRAFLTLSLSFLRSSAGPPTWFQTFLRFRSRLVTFVPSRRLCIPSPFLSGFPISDSRHVSPALVLFVHSYM